MGKRASTMLQGMAVLGAAAVISKLIGTLQKIPLQNLGGDAAYGIFNLVYPIYTLIIVIATAGFPLAVSKFVAEYIALNDRAGARRALRVSMLPLAMMGLCGFALLFFGADRIAAWTGSPLAAAAIRSISLALLIMPSVSAFRGYFQGRQDMIPTAISQIVEQLVRVGTMVALLLVLVAQNAAAPRIAAGAMLGSFFGGLAALLLMLIFWWRDKCASLHATPSFVTSGSNAALMMRMLRYAIPVTLGAIVVPVLGIVDSFTLPQLLQGGQALTEGETLQQFGIYSRGTPLVQLVALLFSSISAALVPAVIDRLSRGKHDEAIEYSSVALRLTWMIGLASSIGLAVAARPINVFLFKTDDGSGTMMILALAIVFSSFYMMSASVLQGWGFAYVPALNLFAAALVKVLLNLVWVPFSGIDGAAWATVFTYVFAAALNAWALKRYTEVKLKRTDLIVKPCIAVGIMAVSVWLIMQGIAHIGPLVWPSITARAMAAWTTVIGVPSGALIYYLAMSALGLKPVVIINKLKPLNRSKEG